MRRRSVLWAALACAALLAGCDAMIPRFEPIRYRLEAQVETPVGVKTGSSVIEVTTDKSLRSFQVRGEAVAVDIAPGQTLFVLLRSPQTVDWAGQALNFFPAGKRTGSQPSDPAARVAQAKSEFDAIRADHAAYPVWDEKAGASADPEVSWPGTPYLVRFRDLADPKSVEQVDPDDLAKSFGSGVRLKSLTVQVTDAPVTTGVEKRLGWLGDYPEPRLATIPQGGVAIPTIAQALSHGDFRKGEHQ